MSGVKYKNIEQRRAYWAVHKWLHEKLARIGLKLVAHTTMRGQYFWTLEGLPEKPDNETWTRHSCPCGREYNELRAIFENFTSEKHFEGKPRSRWH